MASVTPQLLAFHLPQFHPIRENDEWWGKGFTEWTNVVKARPLFRWHEQPHLPADLGFYDLRLPEARAAQAELAREYGIHGFCYYHYWFGGRRLLERPVNDILASGEPDFPFCLCWANENWTRRWDGGEQHVLVAQNHSAKDDESHIRWLLTVFADPRYIRVEGKPLFLIYRSSLLPDPRRTLDMWREIAHREGVGDLFLCRVESFTTEFGDPRGLGFDAGVEFQPSIKTAGARLGRNIQGVLLRCLGLQSRLYGKIGVSDYKDTIESSLAQTLPEYPRFPCVTPRWDNSARRKNGAYIIKGSTPELFSYWLREAQRKFSPASPSNLMFINAWNEWAEGCHLEPCQKWDEHTWTQFVTPSRDSHENLRRVMHLQRRAFLGRAARIDRRSIDPTG